ncbi:MULTISPECIES: YlcI/YnfO family protein [Tatumella]|uniref:DUF3950 domain-containing protein n=2 Tax=Tatumella ptyseos TaxID=82987 RepID=A0A085JMC1_9GAMM|nr:YlcI/YnfO family protein [Tatumella sp. UCD-D_suzukii]KFD21617.1 hypothetical protein GTPT_0716 [Tatumella ptyseos ATCC 33301]SQK77245.1 Uncharacterised protein [Tatumella ptyseos]
MKMSTSKTRAKHIRFPHQMLSDIQESLKQESSENFSAWVIEACRIRLRKRN